MQQHRWLTTLALLACTLRMRSGMMRGRARTQLLKTLQTSDHLRASTFSAWREVLHAKKELRAVTKLRRLMRPLVGLYRYAPTRHSLSLSLCCCEVVHSHTSP